MDEIQFRYRRRILMTVIISSLISLIFVLFFLSNISLLEYILSLHSHEPIELLTQENLPLLCTVFTVGGILCFSICFAVMQRSHILYVEEISRAMTEIAKGNFHQTADVKGDDELSDIAQHLNTMAAQVCKLREQERQAEQSKNELITNVAHDLRTPLTAILGYLELLSNPQMLSEEKRDHYLSIVLQKAKHLQHMIEELFGFTKLNHDALPLQPSSLDIVKLLAQLLDEFYPLFARNRLSYEYLPSVDSLTINGDGNLLARLFDNLINNAIKYGREGKLIRVILTKTVSDVSVQVINYGLVIPPNALEKIFEKFYRTDVSRSSNTGGTGLGLAIAQNIAERHGGNITVKSDLDGTVFQVTLPLHYDFNKQKGVFHDESA